MKGTMLWFRLLALILLIFFITAAFKKSLAQERVFTIGVVPQFTPVEIYERWGPLVKELENRTGLKFELKTYKSIPEFEKAFLKGEPDFVFMNPYHQVMAYKAQKYIPLVRDKTPLTGILVVRRDSPVKEVKDLDGKVIAFPAPNAFAASLYMRALLTEKFKISFIPEYVKTHDNVYRHVILGKAQAGGGVNNTFLRQPEEVKRELRILYETPPTAPHPFSVHPRVPKEVRDKVKRAILDMANEPSMKALLDRVQMPNPVPADYARDYKPLEKLNLEKYVVLE
jgi:ABC-type phosphate/phosphonate transport system, periplasmic component